MNLLRCETCDIELHGRDVYFDGVDSRCRTCNEPVGEVRRRSRKFPGQPVVPLPPSVSVEQRTEANGVRELVLEVPWRLQRPQDGMRLFGWIIVATVILGAIQLGASKLVAFALGAAVIGLMRVIRLVNYTKILVRPDAIRLSHHPIPWRRRVLETKDLEQLYVNRRPIAQKVFDYSVRALLDDGRDIVLFRALKEQAVAFHLERYIEEHLHIEDRRVRGEYIAPPPPDPAASSPYLDESAPPPPP